MISKIFPQRDKSQRYPVLSKLGIICSRAAMVCMLSMTSVSLANNKGNLGNTLHDLTGDAAFKNLVVAVGTAGTSSFLSSALPLPTDAHALVRHGVRETIRETTSVSVRAAITGQPLRGSIGQSALNVLGNTLQGAACEKIGNAVDQGSLSKPAAVGVHALLGTGAQLVRGGTLQEALVVGGATGIAEGAMYACVDYEALAEKVNKDHPHASWPEKQRYMDEATRPYREMAHITAATLAGVALNSEAAVHASSHSAQMAMDHNFGNLVIGAGLTLHDLQPYYEAYEAAGGGEAGRAAVAALIEANGGYTKLGIKIGVNFLGGALVMKAGGKLVNFIRGAGMSFARGKNAEKVAKAEKFLEEIKAAERRMAEVARENNTSDPSGRSGFEMSNPKFQKVRNEPTTIDGVQYSGHDLDQMQNRGVPPSVVKNTIQNGVKYVTKPGTIGYYDSVNNVRVIVSESTNQIVTTIRGVP